MVRRSKANADSSLPAADREDLADRLAKEAGLPVSLAQLVLDTVKDVVRAEHPHLAGKVDALLADERRANQAIRWIAKLGATARPDDDAIDPSAKE